MNLYLSIYFAIFFVVHTYAQTAKDTGFVPMWASDAIYYQIFPERFANGDSSNDPLGTVTWDAAPTINNYFGGDIKGIINHLDYLKELGINAIYLNPIFESSTNHKYHTTDYYKIDDNFGDEEIFKRFVDESHQRNIRVIIDGVFNHTGTDFFAFRDIVKNEKNSKYLKWYDVHSFPVRLPPEKPNYEAWWGNGELPKLMADNPEVRKYLLKATRYWMKMGIDGWRLDVPNEMSHDFWIQWRKLVKEENPDALIIGEIWDDASTWLKGDQFDAVMNYRFRGACVGFIALENRNAFQFDSILTAVRNEYPSKVNYALQNLIGSHDTERFLTLCENDTNKLKIAVLVQMTYIGSPMIYYGDDIGMTGGKDPDCRRTMSWDKTKWNIKLLEWYRKLISIRNKYPVMRRGTISSLIVNNENKIAGYVREYENSKAVIILNVGKQNHSIPYDLLPRGINKWTELISDKMFVFSGYQTKEITIPAESGIVIFGTEDN